MTTTTRDPYAEERGILDRLGEALTDLEPEVILGEYVTDRMLGDPDLRPSLLYAHHARELLDAALTMIVLALDAIPPAREVEEERPEDTLDTLGGDPVVLP